MYDSLNLNWYDDSNVYSDGSIETEILQSLEEGISERDLLLSDDRWPVYYHFSPERQALINWITEINDADVLEIGSGMGAITKALCPKADHVTCVELSLIRSKINSLRNNCFKNLDIIVANLNDVPFDHQFDIVTLIGVLEYCGRYTKADNPYLAFLNKVKTLIKPGGKLILAIENRLGLKYFAGADEDHYSKPFVGLDNYPDDQGIRTFSYQELMQLLDVAGSTRIKTYLPFPDYKFARSIVAADETGLYKNAVTAEQNYGAYNYSTFNQTTVFKTIADQMDLKHFANSFLVIVEF